MKNIILNEAFKEAPNAKSILEVGFGKEDILNSLHHIFPTAKIYGIDPQPKSISLAQRKYNHHKSIEVTKSPVETLPYPAGTIDLVITNMSFHHWTNKKKGLAEIARILRPEGVLILGDPLSTGIISNRFIHWLAEKTDGGKFTKPEVLDQMLTEVGIKVLRKQVVPKSGGTLYVVVGVKL